MPEVTYNGQTVNVEQFHIDVANTVEAAEAAAAVENTDPTTGRTLRSVGMIRRRGETAMREVMSPYTNDEAITMLLNVSGEFAADLARSHSARGTLSPAQWAWVHQLVLDHERGQQQAEQVAATPPRFPRIAEMFTHAAEHLRQPRIDFRAGSGRLTLNRAGERSRVPGSINVTDGGRYPHNTFYGRIHPDGRWEPSQRNPLPESLDAVLVAVEADPAAAIGANGRLQGACCFCRRALSDERSLLVGYGPICADHFHLPWGDRPAGDATAMTPATVQERVTEALLNDVMPNRPQCATRTPRRRRTFGDVLRGATATATRREIRTVVCPTCGENMDEGGTCRAC